MSRFIRAQNDRAVEAGVANGSAYLSRAGTVIYVLCHCSLTWGERRRVCVSVCQTITFSMITQDVSFETLADKVGFLSVLRDDDGRKKNIPRLATLAGWLITREMLTWVHLTAKITAAFTRKGFFSSYIQLSLKHYVRLIQRSKKQGAT